MSDRNSVDTMDILRTRCTVCDGFSFANDKPDDITDCASCGGGGTVGDQIDVHMRRARLSDPFYCYMVRAANHFLSAGSDASTTLDVALADDNKEVKR